MRNFYPEPNQMAMRSVRDKSESYGASRHIL
jgi:hypothetical protein